MMKGHVLIFARRYAESIEALEEALRIEPDNRGVYDNLSSAYHLNGDYDEALRLVRKFFPGDQELEDALDRGYEEGGYRAALVRWANTLAGRPGVAEVMSYFIAGRYAWAGEKERTMELLELAYETRNANMTTLNSPEFDLVRDEPRFIDLVRRVGLPE